MRALAALRKVWARVGGLWELRDGGPCPAQLAPALEMLATQVRKTWKCSSWPSGPPTLRDTYDLQ
jgi:hypothetical protein